jgi:hypothetical protein
MLALKYDVELGKALKGDNSKIKNKVVDNAMKLLDDEEKILREFVAVLEGIGQNDLRNH